MKCIRKGIFRPDMDFYRISWIFDENGLLSMLCWFYHNFFLLKIFTLIYFFFEKNLIEFNEIYENLFKQRFSRFGEKIYNSYFSLWKKIIPVCKILQTFKSTLNTLLLFISLQHDNFSHSFYVSSICREYTKSHVILKSK